MILKKVNIFGAVLVGFFFTQHMVEITIPENWENFKRSWELVFSGITASGTVAIPVIFYFLGKKETKRKEDRDAELDRRNSLVSVRVNQIAPLLEKIHTSQIKYQNILGDVNIVDKRSAIRECFMEFMPLNNSLYAGIRSIERTLLPQEKSIFTGSKNIIKTVSMVLYSCSDSVYQNKQPNWDTLQHVLVSLMNTVRTCVDDIDECVIYQYSKNIDEAMVRYLKTKNEDLTSNINNALKSLKSKI